MRITSTNPTVEEPQRGFLSRSVTLNWEVILFIVILLLAIFTRFYMLGDRVMSHDESLHTRYSWNLYEEGNFQHTPLMHGPILFHFTALSYALFGDSDFSARIYTSVLSVLLVMSPLLFRRWLGRWGTILASLMLLISPLILYYGRYIRHDTPSILSALVMIWAMMMYVGGPPNQQRRAHWLYIIAAAMIWNLGSKETAFIYIAIVGIFLVIYFAARLLQYFLRMPGKPIFYITMIGIFLGGVMSMGMYIILDIIQFDMLSPTEGTAFGALSLADQQIFWLWTVLAIASVVLVTIGTMFWAFRSRLRRIPWGELAAVLSIALLVCLALVVLEEVSHTTPTSAQPAVPADPTVEGGAAEGETGMSWAPMFLVWGGALAAFGVLFFTRLFDASNYGGKDKPGRGFWGTLDLFPEFDLIVVIGTLILPWATAFVPYLMRGTPADVAQVANSLPTPIFTFIATYVPRVGSAEQIGQFLLHLYAWVPLMALSISIGLMWNWRRWLIASAIFHVLFAFFFTTIFTNIAGLATGMIYSLGYWLEQQGVRRGSQPQYYYLLIIMPFYEFLPVIGGVLSMFAGMGVFWRWRRKSLDAARGHAEDASLPVDDPEQLPEPEPELHTPPMVIATETAELPEARVASAEEEEIFLRSSLEGEESDERFGEPIELEEEDKRRLVARRYRQKIWGNPLYYLFVVLLVVSLGATLLSGFAIIMAPGGLLSLAVAYFAWRSYRDAREEIERELALGLSVEAIEEGGLAKRKRDQRERDTQAFVNDLPVQTYPERNALTSIPFLIFFSWLAVLNLVGYSLAGEKMPWLGTHLTMPLIFLTAWYFGRIISKIKWRKFADRGWIILALLIVFVIALSRVIQPLLMGTPPFAGLSQEQLQTTYSWLGALVIVAGTLVAVGYLRESVGWKHVRQLFAVVIFGLLSIITFRSAWLASFVNYDYATEFLVYAHAAPGVKWVLEDIEELSLRTTDGYDLAIAYDNEVSWPYSWYFRDFNNVTYTGENPTVQNLDGAVVVVVGAAHLGTVEPILEDRYVRYDHIRLWWPMQDYFYLTPDRVNNLLDFSADNPTAAQIRQGIFDIWWERNYSTYGAATNKNFDVTNWPVSDRMHFYVRRDIAAQIWPYGVGDGTVINPLDEIEVNQCNANWQDMTASLVLEAPDGLTNPIGIDIAPDGTIYVAEEFGHEISAFNPDGSFIEGLGQEGTAFSSDAVQFNRPNSLSIAPDGTIYIADTWNYRVQILNDEFQPLDFFGQPGTFGFDAPVSPTDALWGPRDVTVSDDGLIFVSDTGNKRVRVYREEDGVILHQYDIASGGSAPGQLDEPSGLVVSDDGRLFVADTWNRRISVFTLDGAYLDSYDVRGWYEEQGNRPYLAIDEQRGLLYTTDPDAGRVLVYTLSGECVGSFGQPAATNPTLGQFGIAAGIAVDEAGFVYVVDNQLGRVLQFMPFPYDPTAVEVPAEDDLEAAESLELDADDDPEVDISEEQNQPEE